MPDKMLLKSRSSMVAISVAGLALIIISLVAIWLVVGNKELTSVPTSTSDNLTDNSPTPFMPSSHPTALPDTFSPLLQQPVNTTLQTSTLQDPLSSKPSSQIYLLSTALPTDELTIRTQAQHILFCEFPASFQSSCPKIRQSASNDKSNSFLQQNLDVVQLSSFIRLVEYSVNLSITDKGQNLLSGSLDLLLEVLKEGDSIALHAGRNIRFIEQNQISIWLCNSAQPLCPKSVTRLMDKQLLVIGLENTLKQGTIVRLKLGKFESEIVSNPGLTIQLPSKWEKDRAWIVASYNLDNGSRLVWPGLDEQGVVAALRLCVQHPKDTVARSNMPKKSSQEEEKWTTSCFQESPFMNTQHFAFLLFDNLKIISEAGTKVEVFVGKHIEPENQNWIMEETSKALDKMASLTSTPYPLEKLTVVYSPLHTDATHNLGLILIKETWIEYPKYFYAHSLLASQVVEQWVGGILTICEKCLQASVCLN